MPVHRSAVKRMKQTKKRQIKNRAVKSSLKIKMKKFVKLLGNEKVDEARKFLPGLLSAWDKAASQGVIHKNTASRQKSRLTKQSNKAMPQRKG